MSYDPTQPVPSPFDPTQHVPPPLDPTQREAPPAPLPPAEPSVPLPAVSSASAETWMVAPPPPGGYESPTAPPSAALPFLLPRDWPIVALAFVYVLAVILGFIGVAQTDTPTASPSSAPPSVFSTIALVLLVVDVVGVLILDWRGYLSARGLVRRRSSSSDRQIVAVLVVLFCFLFLPIYYVRRFMGKPQEGPPMPDFPAGSWPMAAPMQPSDPYSGPYSGPMLPYQSGPMPAPPPGYGPAQPPMPVYMPPPMPPAAPPVVIVQGAQPQPQQLVRTYKGGWHAANQKFQKDARHLARQGWRVQQVVTTQSGAVGVNIGFGVGVGRSKAKELTVIYTR